MHPEYVAEQRVINRSGWALLVLTEVFHKQRWVGGNLSSMVKSQHCCCKIDVTLALFSAVICLLVPILMHADAGPKSLPQKEGVKVQGR